MGPADPKPRPISQPGSPRRSPGPLSRLPSDLASKGPQRHRGRPPLPAGRTVGTTLPTFAPRSDRPCVPMKLAATTATIIRDLRPATDRREGLGSHANRVRRRFWRAPLTPRTLWRPTLFKRGDEAPKPRAIAEQRLPPPTSGSSFRGRRSIERRRGPQRHRGLPTGASRRNEAAYFRSRSDRARMSVKCACR